MSIRELESFDGKHTDVSRANFIETSPNEFVNRGLVLSGCRSRTEHSDWSDMVLKRLAENHVQFKEAHLIALFGSLCRADPLAIKLHVCQVLPYLMIPKESESILICSATKSL